MGKPPAFVFPRNGSCPQPILCTVPHFAQPLAQIGQLRPPQGSRYGNGRQRSNQIGRGRGLVRPFQIPFRTVSIQSVTCRQLVLVHAGIDCLIPVGQRKGQIPGLHNCCVTLFIDTEPGRGRTVLFLVPDEVIGLFHLPRVSGRFDHDRMISAPRMDNRLIGPLAFTTHGIDIGRQPEGRIPSRQGTDIHGLITGFIGHVYTRSIHGMPGGQIGFRVFRVNTIIFGKN